MDIKTSKIIKCEYSNPHIKGNDTIHYHKLTLSNGDVVSCGVNEKFPDKISEGKTIKYTQNGNTIKLHYEATVHSPAAMQNNEASSKKGYGDSKKAYGPKPTDFLGYSASYAKDIVVAAITGQPATAKKDAAKVVKEYVEIWKKATDEIYAHIQTHIPKQN